MDVCLAWGINHLRAKSTRIAVTFRRGISGHSANPDPHLLGHVIKDEYATIRGTYGTYAPEFDLRYQELMVGREASKSYSASSWIARI